MMTFEFDVIGKTPSPQEAAWIAQIVPRKPFPDALTRRRARKWCGLALAALLASLRLIWLPPDELFDGSTASGLRLLTAFLASIAGCFIVAAYFRSAFCALPAKTPEKLLRWMFFDAYLKRGEKRFADPADCARLLKSALPVEAETRTEVGAGARARTGIGARTRADTGARARADAWTRARAGAWSGAGARADCRELAAYIGAFREPLLQGMAEAQKRKSAEWDKAVGNIDGSRANILVFDWDSDRNLRSDRGNEYY
ncbi:MAG: hypothetical protein LBL83_11460 [Clostridiales bacterium]|jgi:hypothetical protein|nr:hypothetical protein [Clostridiales bacterium]